MNQEAKTITTEEVKELWELYREPRLTPPEWARLAGCDKSYVYRQIKADALKTHELNDQVYIHIVDLINLYWLIDRMDKEIATLRQIAGYDEYNKPIYDKGYMAYSELYYTVQQLAGSMRTEWGERAEEEPAFSRLEILRMRLSEIIEHICTGDLDGETVVELLLSEVDELGAIETTLNTLQEQTSEKYALCDD